MLVWTLLYFFNFTLRTRKYSRLLGQTTPEIFKLKPEGVERRNVPPVFQHLSQMLRLLSFVAPASVSGEPETILLDIRQKRSNQFFFTLSTKAVIARMMIKRHPQSAESATMRFCFSSQSMRLQRRKVVWIECWHRSTEFGKVSSDQAGSLPVLQSNVQLGRCTLSFTVCNLTRVFRSRGCQER